MTSRRMIYSGHNTQLEKDFIDWLGKGFHFDWSKTKSKENPTRLELLRGYSAALRRRSNWGDINKVEIHGYLSNAIIEERHKAQAK